ncbi:uncharacterized protein LOC133777569 isoform X2 [Humulus lupulus]|uniref:uncharacterized protein LOC133777569 isoform X2 n=1 Tax=Humulus lupulus TaxID=3486 RepID=UPI002B401AB9|nr:uncharacterized protein LOC133777569 isoform X2 [Humulus lupulus]
MEEPSPYRQPHFPYADLNSALQPNPMRRRGESRTLASSMNDTVIDEQCDPNLSVSENGPENPCGYGERNVFQAWNSKYFQGESMVVVAQPNYGVGEWGEPRSTADYKPLGLPVRSLKSRIRKRDSAELVNDYESGSGSQGSLSKSSVKDPQENFGELGPQNEGHEFSEAVASPSPVPWRSGSGRRAMREKLYSDSRPSHFRPLSVDETQFESLRKTRSPFLRSAASFSFRASSSSPGNGSPSHSVSSEEISSKMEDECSNTKSFQGSYASSSSPSAPNIKKPDVRNSKSYQESSGSDSPPSPKLNDEASEVMNSEMEDDGNRTKGYGWSPAPSDFPLPPKPMNDQASEVMNSEMEQDGSKPNGFRGSSASSGFPLLPKPIKQGCRKTKSFQGSSASGSASPPKPVNDKASFSGFHARGHSVGSFYENDLAGPKDYLKEQELSESRREDLLSNKESEASSLKSERKVSSPTKASLRGKSVRTIRSRGPTTKAYDNGDMAEEMYGNIEMPYVRKETVKYEGVDSLVSGSSKPNLDNASAMKKNTVPEYQNRERQEFSENVSKGSEEDDAKNEAEDRANKFWLSSRGDADSESVVDATSDSNEVDKKAGEFIAKFREQIMLQKMASIDRSKGLKLGGDYLK